MDAITAWLEQVAASPWLAAVLFVLVVADAFLVVLPSETFVVALGSLALSTGAPPIALVLAVATAGAVVGDNACYWIGRRIGTERFRWMRHPRIAAAIEHARVALRRRPAAIILTARYIPFARIAANLDPVRLPPLPASHPHRGRRLGALQLPDRRPVRHLVLGEPAAGDRAVRDRGDRARRGDRHDHGPAHCAENAPVGLNPSGSANGSRTRRAAWPTAAASSPAARSMRSDRPESLPQSPEAA